MGKWEKKQQAPGWKRSMLLYLHDLVYLLVTVMVVFLLFFREVVVSGDSMYDTLLDGDYLLVQSSLLYREPKQGDIVVVCKESYDNGTPIVKRVIATEGQVVDIDAETGMVMVDDVVLDEPYISDQTTVSEPDRFPQLVKEDCIFVMGDNRPVSLDSRSSAIGQVRKDEVLGKAVFLFFPGTSHNERPREYDRIGAVE